MKSSPLCTGCPLEGSPSKLILPSGPFNSPVAIIGEAGGKAEGAAAQPFIGPAGGILNQALKMVFLEREEIRVSNVLSCAPPNDFLLNAPWEFTSINHCAVHRDPILREPHKVFVAAGAISARTLLNQPKKGFKIEEWHSTVNRFGSDQWLIPMYHPASLFHKETGGWGLFAVLLYALRLAKEVAEKGWEADPISTIVDPSPDDYRAWASHLLEGSPDTWLPVDVETAEKLEGKAEDELESDSYNIVRINFAYHPDEGLTVPFSGPWHETTRALLAGPQPKVWWNRSYDLPRLRAAGFKIGGKQLDFMDAWHMLQSDLKMSLGFVAPLYSKFGAWKHLSGSDPGQYAALDAAQTLRCAMGIARDLQQEGRWEAFYRDMYTLDTRCLKPAEKAGVLIDIPQLQQFEADLRKVEEDYLAEIRSLVPEEARPLVSGTPENPSRTGWLRRPKDREGVIEQVVVDKKSGAMITKYFVRGEFNPNSGLQILAYLACKGLKPGKGKGKKKGDGDSVDALALDGLAKKDRVCELILKRRKVGKVKSTYVDPTLALVTAPGSDGRLHTTFTRKPSTQRLSCVAAGTPIEVVRDISAYPAGVPIEAVQSGMYAYTFDQDLKLTLRRVVSAWKTGHREVVRVHWRRIGGNTTGFVDLTPEHPVRLVGGAYRQAQYLAPLDRVMALSRGVTNWGYARLWATGHKEIAREHRFIFRELQGWDPEVVHHINENKLDNRLENLEGSNKELHAALHYRLAPAERRQRQRAGLEKAQQAPKNHPGPNPPSKEWMEYVLWQNAGKPTAFRDQYGFDYETMQRYMQIRGVDWKAIAKHFNGAGERIMPEMIEEARRAYKAEGQIAAQHKARLGYYRLKEAQEALGLDPYNHLIVRVEHLTALVDVYDLEIEGTENFIAGELCVHNSKDPNLQNVVQR